MFFIIDCVRLLKVLKVWPGECETCHKQGQIELIMTYQCLRLFFIPLIKWHKVYFLRHSCGGKVPVSEEVVICILNDMVDTTELHFNHITEENQEKDSTQCIHCGKVSDQTFIYCPYCGQKKRF